MCKNKLTVCEGSERNGVCVCVCEGKGRNGWRGEKGEMLMVCEDKGGGFLWEGGEIEGVCRHGEGNGMFGD